MTEGQPVACTLTGENFRDRLTWIEQLTRDALRGHERADLTLTLRYAREAAQRVQEMVRKERACCGFLTFETREQGDEVWLAVTAPDLARPTADALLSHSYHVKWRHGSAMPTSFFQLNAAPCFLRNGVNFPEVQKGTPFERRSADRRTSAKT